MNGWVGCTKTPQDSTPPDVGDTSGNIGTANGKIYQKQSDFFGPGNASTIFAYIDENPGTIADGWSPPARTQFDCLDARYLASLDGERHTLDRVHRAVIGIEGHPQVTHLEECHELTSARDHRSALCRSVDSKQNSAWVAAPGAVSSHRGPPHAKKLTF